MTSIPSFLIDMIKMLLMLSVLFAIIKVILSPVNLNKSAKKTIALMAYLPMGIIAIISYIQSVTSKDPTRSEMVLLAMGLSSIILSIIIPTAFGSNRRSVTSLSRGVLANVLGNFIYDLLKFSFKVLLGAGSWAGSFLVRLFRR